MIFTTKRARLSLLVVSCLCTALTSAVVGQQSNPSNAKYYQVSPPSSGSNIAAQRGFSPAGFGQYQPPAPYPIPNQLGDAYIHTYSRTVPGLITYQDGGFKYVTENLESPAIRQAYQASIAAVSEAIKSLRSESVSEEDRASARKVVAGYLAAEFEQDLSVRQKQLKALEDQVTKLKAQLEKRAGSKGELIELRLKLIENETDGLAFPQSWTALPGSSNQLPGFNMPGGYYPAAPPVP